MQRFKIFYLIFGGHFDVPSSGCVLKGVINVDLFTLKGKNMNVLFKGFNTFKLIKLVTFATPFQA